MIHYIYKPITNDRNTIVQQLLTSRVDTPLISPNVGTDVSVKRMGNWTVEKTEITGEKPRVQEGDHHTLSYTTIVDQRKYIGL